MPFDKKTITNRETGYLKYHVCQARSKLKHLGGGGEGGRIHGPCEFT